MSNNPQWFVVHTYSGYENKVKANIEKLVENRGIGDQILEVVVPLTEEVVIKNGEKVVEMKKNYHGYVLIHMVMNDDTWFIVRNTRGVTSFVGPGSKPVPLTEDEVQRMGIGVKQVAQETAFPFEVDDLVSVKSELFGETVGSVLEVNPLKNTVTVGIKSFGRETPTEFDIKNVKKI